MADDDKDDDKDIEKSEGEAGDAAAAEAEAAAKAKKKKNTMIMIAAGLAVVILGGGGAAFFLMHKSSGNDDDKTKAEQAAADKKDGDKKTVYYSLGDLLVNLSGEGKHPNYLKVKVSLELADEKDLPLMDSIKPRIIDNFQVYLRELRVEDLRGSAGMYRLREELLMRVTEAAQPVRVRDVLFQEMLVQ